MHSTDPAEVSSATPLNSLSAVALDTETTGLAVGSARLIQIGAVRLGKGRLVHDDTYSTLANPGVPIPPETTRIHGLTDADVAEAPRFADIRAGFGKWMGRKHPRSRDGGRFGVARVLHLLANNAADVRVPLGMFNRFRLRDGRMDVKMGGILPIFSAARVGAIRHRVGARATSTRLETVQRMTGVHAEVFDNLIEAHRIILRAILKQQLYDLDQGIALSNKVAPDKMKPALRNSLKWALRQVPAVADVLNVPVR